MNLKQPDVKKIALLWDDASEDLMQTLNMCSESILNTIPSPDRWSIAQVGDHLLKSYDLLGILNGATEKPDRDFDEKVATFWEVFKNDEIKMNSPEAILPETGLINKEKLTKDLQRKINDIKNIIQTKDLKELCMDYAIPQNGTFTRWEWISFAIVHTERHVRQMKRIYEKVKS